MLTVEKILLIDDDVDEFDIFTDAFAAVNPAIQLKYIAQPSSFEQAYHSFLPDLIFLDVNMPVVNGFDWLKKLENYRQSVPVIMYSTSENPDRVNKAYMEGASLYVVKPLEFSQLVHMLEGIVHLDWTYPADIKSMHYTHGRYSVFKR